MINMQVTIRKKDLAIYYNTVKGARSAKDLGPSMYFETKQ